jgi:hypothetical protein
LNPMIFIGKSHAVSPKKTIIGGTKISGQIHFPLAPGLPWTDASRWAIPVGPVGKWRGCWENGLWEWLRNHLELSKVQKAPEASSSQVAERCNFVYHRTSRTVE